MKIYFFIIAVFFSLNSQSQAIFTQTIRNDLNERTFRVAEDNNGNYIICGWRESINNGSCFPIVFKINQNGDVIDSLFIFENYQFDATLTDVLFINENYVFIGLENVLINIPNNLKKRVFYLKTDSSFNIIDTIFYDVGNEYGIDYSKLILDNDTNIVNVGYYYSPEGKGSIIQKMSKNGDSIRFIEIPADSNRMFINIVNIDSLYYIFSYKFGGYESRLLFVYDKNLNLLETNPINENIHYIYTPIFINDSTYFCSGYNHYISYRKLAIVKSNINGVIEDSLQFGIPDSNNYPALYDALCIDENKYLYYLGSPLNGTPDPPYGINEPSKIQLVKLDTNFNIIWDKLYGGDAFYMAMNVITTSDGGVLMHATRNDLYDNLRQLDIHLIKVDSAGNTTWAKNIAIKKEFLKLYPNPANDLINIELQAQTAKIESIKILNAQGKILLSNKINTDKLEINISNLNSGVYFIEATTNSGERVVKKFVKQ